MLNIFLCIYIYLVYELLLNILIVYVMHELKGSFYEAYL